MTNDELKEKLTDSEILFLTIVGEARSESVEGQIAVANVIVNRSKYRKLSIKDVCLQRLQFSCWNEDDPNRQVLIEEAKKMLIGEYSEESYKQIQWIVDGVVGDKINDNTRGRDHYMTTSLFNSNERPNWAKTPKNDPIKIGNHTFLNV